MGGILTLVIAGLLLTKGDGLGAINTAMIIEALPFSVVMALMGIALIKALVRDGMRNVAKAETPAEAVE
jgi:choline-glycine betaine transporter